ncbi:MAG: DUF3247 family protein [Pseudomonadota bacterium]|nr:DUF3247 family protein [Pseudomonadota bacterium]
MTSTANRVYRDPAAIERLQSLIAALPNGTLVALKLEDGSELRCRVAARPLMQVFVDADGQEGSNAVVRVEPLTVDPFESVPPQDLWLDSIVAIRNIGPP